MSDIETTQEETYPMVDGWDLETFHRLETVEPQYVYEELQRECPVRHLPQGDVLLLKMADVKDGLRHEASRSIKDVDQSILGNTRRLIPLQLERPEHTMYRRALDRLFTPRKMAALEPSVRALTDELIDAFIDDKEADLYEQFCQSLPAIIFVRMMGIPEADIDYFMEFKNSLLRGTAEIAATATLEEAHAHYVAVGKRCYAYFDKLLDEREASGFVGDDLIGSLQTLEVDDRQLTREEILDITYVLIIAGLDTVAATFASMFSYLARHPEQRRRAVEDRSMWPKVIEELLRWETPVPNDNRWTAEDMDINGTVIPEGRQVNMSLAAANLDPDVFEDPMTVNFDRRSNPHISFGAGMHRCLGSHLARMELRAALDQFHLRLPDYRIKPDAELHYEASMVRVVHHLPIVWD